MRTVTVPGRLMKELRGQTRPALWATGTMGAPLAGGDACALGEDHDPEPLVQPLAAATRDVA